MSRENKQFKKGILAGIIGVLCVEVGIGSLESECSAGDTVLADRFGICEKAGLSGKDDRQNYLEEKDKEDLEEGIYTGLVYG